jgi:hypothetical protein
MQTGIDRTMSDLEVLDDFYFAFGMLRQAVAARKDVTLWKRFMPPLPRLLGGLFAGLLMVHLSIPNQVVSSNELICSSVWDLQCGLAHKRVTAGGRSQ